MLVQLALNALPGPGSLFPSPGRVERPLLRRAIQGLPTRERVGAVRHGRRGGCRRAAQLGSRARPRRRRSRRTSHRPRCGLGLPALHLEAPLSGALPALGFLQEELALAQRGQRRALPAPDVGNAIVDGKALAALRRLGIELRRQPLPLGSEGPAVGWFAGRHANGRCGDKHHSQDFRNAGHHARHVSEVSTSRRASARNSADCISCSRDTVRGNS